MTTTQSAAVIGAFVADALSLGAHWVYNTGVIDKKFGRVEQYYDPLTSYHKGKHAGDFTHYGDQTLVLLESLTHEKGFDALCFANAWRAFFRDYTGYVDQATKATLANMDADNPLTESGSDSDDLAGASRLAVLVSVYDGNADALAEMARAQTAITHNNRQVIVAADFFARIVSAVLAGQSPAAVMQASIEAGSVDDLIAPLITMGLESQTRDTRETIAEFGQMCSVEAGLPSAVHLIARYENDYRTAMVENVMAGGDSSARGMIAGMVLGAALGMEAIPDIWRSGMAARDRINTLLGLV